MTRFADPQHCPDCGASIAPGQPACAGCGLPLAGELAQRLYGTLVSADRLLAELRSSAGTAPWVSTGSTAVTTGSTTVTTGSNTVGTGTTTVVTGTTTVETGTTTAESDRPTRARGLGAASVPKILLALGAGCVLAAALVFLVVTWSVMGVGGRTATLVALTAASGVLAGWLARRDLRAAAESLTLVTLGLLALDLVGAADAGWFGRIDDAGLSLLLGLVLAAASAGAAVLARRTPVRRLLGAELAFGLGTAFAAVGTATLDAVETSPAILSGVAVAAALTVAASVLELVWARWSAAAVTSVVWLVLLGHATTRAAGQPDLESLWWDLQVWPLLAAAALAGGLAPLHRLPRPARVAAAGLGYAVAVLALVMPVVDEGATAVAGSAAMVLVVTAALVRAAPRPWSFAGLVAQGGAGFVVLVAGLGLTAEAGRRVAETASAAWSGSATGRLDPWLPGPDLPAAWLLPLLAAALLLTAASTASLLAGPSTASLLAGPGSRRLPPLGPAVGIASLWLLAAAGVAGLSLYEVPVWTAVAASLVLSAGFLVGWHGSPASAGRAAALAAAASFLLLGVGVSAYDQTLTGLALAVAVPLVAWVHLRTTSPEISAAAGALMAAAVAADAWTWTHLASAPAPWASLVALVLAAAAALPPRTLPAPLWVLADRAAARAGLEAGAAASALAVGIAGVLGASPDARYTWSAVYLTLAGAAVTALALLAPDRRRLLPVGALLLAAASWVRLWDIGVRDPEPYTLPTAALLAAAGLWRLRSGARGGSLAALGPGLGLALVPSLLWALVGEPGPRALVLGLGCLVLVLVGARVGWTAPLVWGAAVGAVLVVRLTAPYVEDAVPTWVLIGSAGALLITAGVTWEQRLQDTRRLVGYVRGLR